MDVRSPYQLLDWRIVSFSYQNQEVLINKDTPISWALSINISYPPMEQDNKLASVLTISFEATSPGEKGLKICGLCASFCEFDSSECENPQELFDQLMKRTTLLNSLANLRVFLMNQGTLLSIQNGKLTIPHINLNKINISDGITFET